MEEGIEIIVWVVKCQGTIWGVFTEDPEKYYALFEKETGYPKDEFYAESFPLSSIPTSDNIGICY